MTHHILVTGNAGFIGSAVIRHLITSTDSAVFNLDELTYAGNLELLSLSAASPSYRFSQAVFAEFKQTAIMHLAVELHVDHSIGGPAEFIQTNIAGTKGKVGETYNIGVHKEKRNVEVVETICALIEELVPDKLKGIAVACYPDLTTFVKGRPGHDKSYTLDGSNIERKRGRKPQETFQSGIRKSMQWYLESREWWERVLNGDYRLGRLRTQA